MHDNNARKTQTVLLKICIFNKTCTFVRPGDARVTWRNAFDLHVEKYSGKNDCGERPLLCIFDILGAYIF